MLGQKPDRQWELLIGELEASSGEQEREWGDVDDVLIARYLAGQCDKREQVLIERARERFPAVRECIDLVLAIEGDGDSATLLEHVRPFSGLDRQWQSLVADLEMSYREEKTGQDELDESSIAAYLTGEGAEDKRMQVQKVRPPDPPISRMSFLHWAAAACVLIALSFGVISLRSINSIAEQFARSEAKTDDQQVAVADGNDFRSQIQEEVARLTQSNQAMMRHHAAFYRPYPPNSVAAIEAPERATSIRGQSVAVSASHETVKYLALTAHLPPTIEPAQANSERQRVLKPIVEPHATEPTPAKAYPTPTKTKHITVCRPVVETSYRSVVFNLEDDPADHSPAPTFDDLVNALDHPNLLAVRAACDVLPRVTAPSMRTSVRTSIIEALQRRDARGLEAARFVLRVTGAPSLSAVMDALADSEAVVRWAGLYACLDAGWCSEEDPANLVPYLVAALSRPNEDVLVRKMAVYLLGECGVAARPATGDLLRMLQEQEDPQIRRWAAYALSQIGPEAKQIVPHLIALLLERDAGSTQNRGDDRLVFPAVAYALSQLCKDAKTAAEVRQVEPVLIEGLKDSDPSIRTWSAIALLRINEAQDPASRPPVVDESDGLLEPIPEPTLGTYRGRGKNGRPNPAPMPGAGEPQNGAVTNGPAIGTTESPSETNLRARRDVEPIPGRDPGPWRASQP
ncbi:MAG: HEAT repeat domain-containing protein [Candidatus Nealsonbacteria bacterium]|nr:HEAT repeat domain-containing protein [Candidatus Nealsonbacteria bacterium]